MAVFCLWKTAVLAALQQMEAAPLLCHVTFIYTFVLLVTKSEGSLKIINLINRDQLLKYPGGGDTFF